MRRNRQLFRARLEGSRMRATLVIVCGFVMTACSSQADAPPDERAKIPDAGTFPKSDAAAATGGQGGAAGSPADAGSSDDAAEAPAPCTPGATGAAGNPASLVGCVGGSLVDIRAYFFS